MVKRGGETRDAEGLEPLSEIRFETFGEAFAANASVARLSSRDAVESTEIAETDAESRDFEYRDAGGEPFTVNLTNVGSPMGLTTIELKGVDRANLLGALCSALAKAEVSVVSGSIQTDRRTGAVRNARARVRLGEWRTAGPACLRVALRARSERVLACGRARVAGDTAKRRALHRREGTIADRTRARATTRN